MDGISRRERRQDVEEASQVISATSPLVDDVAVPQILLTDRAPAAARVAGEEAVIGHGLFRAGASRHRGAGLLKLFLKERERSPRKAGRMAHSVSFLADLYVIELAALHKMPENAVGVIHAFASCMVQRLARVVLLIPDPANPCDFREGVWEIIEQSRRQRISLTFGTIGR